MSSASFVCCRVCLEAEPNESGNCRIVGLHRIRDDEGHGRWVCENGHEVGEWADGGELDLGVVRADVADMENALPNFAEEWEAVVEAAPGTFLKLEGGTLDGGFLCGRCGRSSTFTLGPGEPWPPCPHCGNDSPVSEAFKESWQ